MSKFFDPLKVFIPKADQLGHKLGEALPKVGATILEALKRHKILSEGVDSLPAPIAKLLPEFLEMAGGGFEIPRDRLPDGTLGDILHEYLNEIIDAAGRGVADKLKANGDKPDDKSGATKAGGTSADPKARFGFVTEGIWYPANCTHAKRPWSGGGKGGQQTKGPEDITLEEAIARGHDHCRRCVRDLDPSATKPAAKNEPKAEEKKPAGPECKLVSADHTLFDLWERLRQEDVFRHRGHSDEFLMRIERDPELKDKFIKAFHGRGTYEQFRALVLATSAEHWHSQLDLLLGKSDPSQGYAKKKLEEERQQWDRAIKTFTQKVKAANVEGDKALEADKAKTAALKARYHGTSGSKVPWAWLITIGALAILSVSYLFISRI